MVAIPLGQGQVFNRKIHEKYGFPSVAIPLGQGQVFNSDGYRAAKHQPSQSLWVRDRFLMQLQSSL